MPLHATTGIAASEKGRVIYATGLNLRVANFSCPEYTGRFKKVDPISYGHIS
jgi:hypothetical protein